MIQEIKYDWILEGDMESIVTLILTCDCIVAGLALVSVELREVACENVLFSLRRRQFVCNGFDSPCGLPRPLLDWFVTRFIENYENSDVLQSEVQDLLESQAISAHWDSRFAA